LQTDELMFYDQLNTKLVTLKIFFQSLSSYWRAILRTADVCVSLCKTVVYTAQNGLIIFSQPPDILLEGVGKLVELITGGTAMDQKLQKS